MTAEKASCLCRILNVFQHGAFAGSGTATALANTLIGQDKWVAFASHEENPAMAFAGETANMMYLSPDAEEVLSTVKDGDIFVVGGLVDRNRHVRASIERANSLGLKALRLPIEEHAAVSRNDFLTISDVCWILSQFAISNDWATVFENLCQMRSRRRMTELKPGGCPSVGSSTSAS